MLKSLTARDCASDLDGSIPFHFEASGRRRWWLGAHSEQRKHLTYTAAALAGAWTQGWVQQAVNRSRSQAYPPRRKVVFSAAQEEYNLACDQRP